MELQKTSLYQKHLEQKGRIVDFSGWALPVEYSSMLEEAKKVRSHCGIFDASHMGEILIRGSGAFGFLQRLASNDISRIQEGKMQYNLLLNPRGGIIDDCMVYGTKEGFFCVVNAVNKDKVWAWFKENQTKDVDIHDRSMETSLIALQGPYAARIIKSLDVSFAALKYMHFIETSLKGQRVLISRSGYTGEDGFEMYVANEDACWLWERLMEEGKPRDLVPCGLGARDILRVEAGYPLYGHELGEDINPYEASLGWAVSLDKDCIARPALLEARDKGTEKKRVGFIMEERAFPRQGYPVYSEGNCIGQVTSGTFSPNLGAFLGLAYVKTEYAGIDTYISISIREKAHRARIHSFPFVKTHTKSAKLANREV
jgi:aminomethyltransferase